MSTTKDPTAGSEDLAPKRSVGALGATLLGTPLVVGALLGVFALQESVGNLVRMGTPWVLAAFAVGAIIGSRTRMLKARWTRLAACLGAAGALTIANGIYYGVVNPLFDQFAQPWTIVGIGVGVLFGLGGHAWGRNRAGRTAMVVVGITSAVVMVEPIGWRAIGDLSRTVSPVVIVLMAIIGLSLPALLLPPGKRLAGTAVAVGATVPFLGVMVVLG